MAPRAGRPRASRSASRSRRRRSSRSSTSWSASWSSPSRRGPDAQIDQRLVRFASAAPAARRPAAGLAASTRAATRDRPFGAPVLVWTVAAGRDGPREPDDARPAGRAHTTSRSPSRPRSTAPRCASPARRPASDHVVVAQSMEPVDDAQRTIVLGELLIAPFLLGRGVPRRRGHRPASGGADRGGSPAPGRVHRRRLARAADAAVGHRGAHDASRWRRIATSRGTERRSRASTASRSGCAGCSRTCCGSPASTRRRRRRYSRAGGPRGRSRRRPRTGSRPSPRRAHLDLAVASAAGSRS